MSHYAIRFLKAVHDGRGVEREVVQAVVRAEGEDREAAVAVAKQRFCLGQNVPSWAMRADRIQVEEVGPARCSTAAALARRSRPN